MKVPEVDFLLPIGYEDDKGNIYRNGTMRMATAIDEIEVNNDDRTRINRRFRDCLILSRVITKLGDFQSVNHEIIENLFEVDFIYLQMLYNKFNQENQEVVITRCPNCNSLNKISLAEMFKDMHHYFASEKKTDTPKAVIEEIKSEK